MGIPGRDGRPQPEREASVANPAVAVARMAGPAVRCSRCGLVLAPRLPALTPRHCPRCLAHGHLAIELEALAPERPIAPSAAADPSRSPHS